MIDIGLKRRRIRDYASDLTRTFFLAEPTKEQKLFLKEIYDTNLNPGEKISLSQTINFRYSHSAENEQN